MKRYCDLRDNFLSCGFLVALLVAVGSAEADFTFGPATNLGPPINTTYADQPVGMTADGLSLYLASKRPGGQSQWVDIWVATRPTKGDPWGEPVNLGPPVNTERSEEETDISADGLTLYIRRAEGYELTPQGVPNWDIWVSTRATTDDLWSTPVNLGPPINTPVEDMDPSISSDGLTLYFSSRRPHGLGQVDLWMTTRPTKDHPWSEPVNLGSPVNSPYSDDCPEISPDDLVLFFTSYRPRWPGDGSGNGDLWMSTRPTKHDPWSEPVNLGLAVNSRAIEQRVRVSPDGALLLFESNRGGVQDIWQSPIIPIVDFNADGKVDSADLCKMADHWGRDYPLCDIGPTPFGDGIVDYRDLAVLTEYWLKEISPVSLVAHWKLNETEGFLAHDSAGDYDGILMTENPLWQPIGGKIDGALEFDGIDDHVSTDFVLNLADGPFSVFAWVKGGEPGQVIISQAEARNWLSAETATGALMTDLTVGLFPKPLTSQAVITDGDWHRVRVCWDGASLLLYVDGVEVAEKTQSSMAGSAGGIYIGAGKNLEAGSFFSGLIDDIRIYDRAIEP